MRSPTVSLASTARPASEYPASAFSASSDFPSHLAGNRSHGPPRPASTSTLTREDMDESDRAYAELMATAKSYRLALATLSTAASSFGEALEACARRKEAREAWDSSDSRQTQSHGQTQIQTQTHSRCAQTDVPLASSLSSLYDPLSATLHTRPSPTRTSTTTADTILAVSGVHHLIANHHQILSETIYRNFEVPLLDELDAWRREMEEEEVAYQTALAQRTHEIHVLEKRGHQHFQRQQQEQRRLLEQGRKKTNSRHIQQAAPHARFRGAEFRAHLVTLTQAVDALEALHTHHAETLFRTSQHASGRIVDAACSVVRAELDIFGALARKGDAGGGLDEVLQKGMDLFAPASATMGDGDGSGEALSGEDEDDEQQSSESGDSGPNGEDARAIGESALFSVLSHRRASTDDGLGRSSLRGRLADRGLLGESSVLFDGEGNDGSERDSGSEGSDPGKREGVQGPSRRKHKPGTGSVSSLPVTSARPFSPLPIRRNPTDITHQRGEVPVMESRSATTDDGGLVDGIQDADGVVGSGDDRDDQNDADSTQNHLDGEPEEDLFPWREVNTKGRAQEEDMAPWLEERAAPSKRDEEERSKQMREYLTTSVWSGEEDNDTDDASARGEGKNQSGSYRAARERTSVYTDTGGLFYRP